MDTIRIDSKTKGKESFNILIKEIEKNINSEVILFQDEVTREVYLSFGRDLSIRELTQIKKLLLKKRNSSIGVIEEAFIIIFTYFLLNRLITDRVKNKLIDLSTNKYVSEYANVLFEIENKGLRWINEISLRQINKLNKDSIIKDLKEKIFKTENGAKVSLGGKNYDLEKYLKNTSKSIAVNFMNNTNRALIEENDVNIVRFIRVEDAAEKRVHSKYENKLFSLDNRECRYKGIDVMPVNIITDYEPFNPPYGCGHILEPVMEV